MELVAVAGVILAGVLFSAVDAALETYGEVRLRADSDSEDRRSRAARRLLLQLPRLRVRFMVGRVLSITTASALVAYRTAELGYGAVGAVVSAAAVSTIYGILARMTSTVASRRAERVAFPLIAVSRPMQWAVTPLSLPVEWLATMTGRVVTEAPSSKSERVAELGIEVMIEQGEEMGSIPGDHAELLRSVLEFKNTVAHEVMVPRMQMVAIEVSTPLSEVIERIVEEGHSRYPVYREKLDQIVGVLYAKDIYQHLAAKERDPSSSDADEGALSKLVRKPVFFVSENQKIGAVLRSMQARRSHMAIVVDEFGGTSGIVTLEDILEEIVGEIQDEHDEEEPPVREVSPGRYEVDAGMSVYDLEEFLESALPRGEGDYDSVGGLVMGLAGHVPDVGEVIEVSGCRFVVLEGDPRRITRVQLEVPSGAEASAHRNA